MEQNIYKVYIKTDEDGFIIAIESGRVLGDNIDGWTEIDEGSGDRHAHAQGNYFDKPLTDGLGNYQYKQIRGKITETEKTNE